MSFWIHSFPFINYISNFRPSTKHKSPGRVEDRLELKSCSCVYFVVWIFHALCPCAAQNQIPRPHPQVTPAERFKEWIQTKHTIKGISETSKMSESWALTLLFVIEFRLCGPFRDTTEREETHKIRVAGFGKNSFSDNREETKDCHVDVTQDVNKK